MADERGQLNAASCPAKWLTVVQGTGIGLSVHVSVEVTDQVVVEHNFRGGGVPAPGRGRALECDEEARKDQILVEKHDNVTCIPNSWECGWGVSSRGGSRWKSVKVIGSQQQRVFQVVGSCWELLGVVGSHWESLGAVGVNYVSLPNQSPVPRP